ncbi:MAG: tripartite tricarboxylate transporter substrate binding protein [Betaproteobacteria bacterium]|nr:tripartite tricarboxylate transporter substrate binding protein [Betaproteobacteria bacterium]
MHKVKFRISRVAATVIVAGAASLLGANAGHAQSGFPDRAIRLIVPFPPGGQTDNVSRRLSTTIAPILGQQLVVDNRGGAAGTLGAGEVARAKPDGYTLLVATTSTHALSPVAMAGISYDPIKDFAPIRVIGTGPISVSVHPSVPARTLKQLVADAKAHPGKYSYGSSGVASINHLAGELFKMRAGKLEILHVPYKGAGPALAELIGGQIPMTCTTLSGALPHHRSGRVRTLAVLKEERSTGAPDIPTAIEGGVPGAVAYTYNILLAPAGTPRGAIDFLTGAMNKAMADRAFFDALIKLGVDPVTDSNPGKAAAMLKTELDKWRPLIESLGLKN